jgi:glucosylceramidase
MDEDHILGRGGAESFMHVILLRQGVNFDVLNHFLKTTFQNLRHWLTGWIDWNLILDEVGGPNYVDNYVDAPILVNTKTGDEIYKQPMYYVLGHFSRFIHPGSVRIGIRSNNHDVTVVAFKRPDGNTVLVFCNE